MSNRISLSFSNTMSGLAGYPYGKSVYDEYVKGKLDENQEIEIAFPPQIEKVATSFTQGFFSDWLDRFGLNWIMNNVKISARNEELVSLIYENITL